jgi:hypothetical protein
VSKPTHEVANRKEKKRKEKKRRTKFLEIWFSFRFIVVLFAPPHLSTLPFQWSPVLVPDAGGGFFPIRFGITKERNAYQFSAAGLAHLSLPIVVFFFFLVSPSSPSFPFSF